MAKTNPNPRPTLDGDQIIPPDRPHHPQETVGSEGGASLVGTPRRVETDSEAGDSGREPREDDASATEARPQDDDRSGRG